VISRREITGHRFSVLVLDEAHRLRHETIGLVRAVSGIEAVGRIALTGIFLEIFLYPL
jgi:SNF2 family DNA or RNA helicase